LIVVAEPRMSRTAVLVAIYLASAALSVVFYNAHPENALEEATAALWALSSLLLGWGTRQPLWALLVFLVVAFASFFGVQDPPVYHEAASMVIFAGFFGIVSAALVVISALVAMAVKHLRRPVTVDR
jgi:hypothetical protein